MGGWIKKLSPVRVTKSETITMQEYKALQKKMRELKIENEILKKAIEEVVNFINKYKGKYTIKRICKVLKFPRSTYYEPLIRLPSKREVETEHFREKLQE